MTLAVHVLRYLLMMLNEKAHLSYNRYGLELNFMQRQGLNCIDLYKVFFIIVFHFKLFFCIAFLFLS